MAQTLTKYYVAPTPGTGPSTPTFIQGVVTTAPAPGGFVAPAPQSPYVPGTPVNLPGGDVIGQNLTFWGQPSVPQAPGDSIPTGGIPPTGGPTCVRCLPASSPNPNATVPTPPPATTTTTVASALAKLSGLPWWVWVLGALALASAFSDRK